MTPSLQEVDVNGVRFSAYNAGHVLGAAMFLIEIAGVKVLTVCVCDSVCDCDCVCV